MELELKKLTKEFQGFKAVDDITLTMSNGVYGLLGVRYQGLPLGFVKNLGNRANNLYPQEWRIRTGYIPEEIKLFLGR
mgnify:CR=1 FL=1